MINKNFRIKNISKMLVSALFTIFQYDHVAVELHILSKNKESDKEKKIILTYAT